MFLGHSCIFAEFSTTKLLTNFWDFDLLCNSFNLTLIKRNCIVLHFQDFLDIQHFLSMFQKKNT